MTDVTDVTHATDLTELTELTDKPTAYRLPGVPDTLAQVGDDIVTVDTRWSFAGSTPQKFDVHVSRSVPLYAEGHDLISRCIEFFCRRGGSVIDIGCSTGTLLARLAEKECCQDLSLIGFDIEADMVRVARQRCMDLENVTIRQGDMLNVDYSGANAVIMYYTLQFLPPGERRKALKLVCDGLVEGGGLFLFEKTLEPDSRTQDIVQQLYNEYKLENGFDPAEIYQKAHSLRSVLAPQRSADTQELLREVGFSSVVTISKYLHFEGMLAIK
ncbi:methyltransferase domain-containing protein [Kitasatospora sp. McL0602]|uniref:methyltransferase domain-containing protein n=1 Tax=Kitasatospora sp. McL0602 TaxID=3439530 RepID=UPI003F8A1077